MKTRRILIVEDVTMIADFMALILNRHGYQVAGIVARGDDAYEAVRATNPDLVLMDIKLEGLTDGIEAAAKIRNNFSIPVVFVSAHTEPAVIARAMTTGANGYIIKPFKGNDLLLALERALDADEAALKSGDPFTLNLPHPPTRA